MHLIKCIKSISQQRQISFFLVFLMWSNEEAQLGKTLRTRVVRAIDRWWNLAYHISRVQS
jgi:hypothetical protein